MLEKPQSQCLDLNKIRKRRKHFTDEEFREKTENTVNTDNSAEIVDSSSTTTNAMTSNKESTESTTAAEHTTTTPMVVETTSTLSTSLTFSAESQDLTVTTIASATTTSEIVVASAGNDSLQESTTLNLAQKSPDSTIITAIADPPSANRITSLSNILTEDTATNPNNTMQSTSQSFEATTYISNVSEIASNTSVIRNPVILFDSPSSGTVAKYFWWPPFRTGGIASCSRWPSTRTGILGSFSGHKIGSVSYHQSWCLAHSLYGVVNNWCYKAWYDFSVRRCAKRVVLLSNQWSSSYISFMKCCPLRCHAIYYKILQSRIHWRGLIKPKP